MSRSAVIAVAASLLIGPGVSRAGAQLSPTAQWATRAANQYGVQANVTYLTATGYESKLDVYRRRDVTTPQPTLIFYHGGGWILGTKESATMALMPWLEMGWNVVNVEYRMANVALAPGAVEDALCALRHVVTNAKAYNVDTSKIVVTGESAGGHLALAAGMIPTSTGLASICAGGGFTANDANIPRVAAIINWYGISDVNDMLTGGGNARSYAVQWLGSAHDKDALAKAMSPTTYVRAGLPPVLSIHGDADNIVPYSHSTRLHEALGKAGTPHELFTVAKGGHGNFNADQRVAIYTKIREFLGKHNLATP